MVRDLFSYYYSLFPCKVKQKQSPIFICPGRKKHPAFIHLTYPFAKRGHKTLSFCRLIFAFPHDVIEIQFANGFLIRKEYPIMTELLYQKIKSIMDTWTDDGIYAVSFFVHSGDYENGFCLSFAISYNTEADCAGADALDEERWNYAFWRQNETNIADTSDTSAPESIALLQWLAGQGVKAEMLGEEDESTAYDHGKYIGRGPKGHYELIMLAAEVAKRFQMEHYLEKKFGRVMPILVHDLEYSWYEIEATKRANPSHEADQFLTAMEEAGFI